MYDGQGMPGLQVIGIFLSYSLLMTLGWGGVTAALVSMVKAGCGAPSSGGEGVGPQALNNKDKEDVTTSMSALCPGGQGTTSKVTAVSFRDERRRMEWSRRRTPLEEDHGCRLGSAETKFSHGLAQGMMEELELKQASWGSLPNRIIRAQQASSTHP